MPELPEVETTVRGLAPVLEGARIASLETKRAGLRRPFPPDLRQRMTGARVTSLARRAKYGLIHTDREDTLIFHLGMSGRWRIDPETEAKHDHLVIITDAGRHLVLNDPRRFGAVDLVASSALYQFAPFAALGPEPLEDSFDAAALLLALHKSKAPIKALLLDQRVVAGLGNIYVCEALNMAHIMPERRGDSLSYPEATALVAAIKAVLHAAIKAGGSTLRDYAAPSGALGYFAKQWRVYGREGEHCACGGTVLRRIDAGRSSFYCAACQH